MRRYPAIFDLRWKAVFLFLIIISLAFVIAGVLHFKLNLDFVISAVIAALIGLALCWLVFGFLFRPLKYIADMTDRMLDGDFDVEVSVKSRDEIGDLADNYNELRKRLSENFSEITTEKHKLETIMKQMADGMVAIGSSGAIITANDAARKILRMSDDDARFKRYDDIILRFTDDLTIGKLREKLAEDIGHARFSYGGRTYEVRFDRYHDRKSKEDGFIIVMQDVTERLKIDNMQTDFVANVSHELKTPLTSIKGYTETLLAGGLQDRAMTQEFLTIINSETDRMNRLVKDILQLSRLDTGRQKWNVGLYDVVALVRSAAKKMDVQAKKKNQVLNIIFNTDQSIMLEIDRDKIEQVAMNIISNSIKYTRERGRIDVDIAATDSEVMITVMDNGIGIPEKELSRVFERFFMVNKARSGEAVGTGLGLSISKQIVEGHGGTISIESIFGKGTRVTVYLPVPLIRGKKGIL